MRLACALLVLSCVLVAQGYRPPRCSNVRCPPLSCRYPYTPRGKCCPVCPRGRKTGTCPTSIPYGRCVSFCNSDFDCPGRNKCCSSGCRRLCLPADDEKSMYQLAPRPQRDCSTVRCIQPPCSDFYIPHGSCCPICRGPRPTSQSKPTRPTKSRRPTYLKKRLDQRDRSQVRPQVKPQVRPQVRPQVKPQVRPQVRPQARPQYRPQARSQVRPQFRSQARSQVRIRARPQFSQQVRTRGDQPDRCWGMLCRELSCPDQYTPPRSCCPVCRAPPPDPCARVLCPEVHCEGSYKPEGKCCQVCPAYSYDVVTAPAVREEPDPCRLHFCPALGCHDQYTPVGQCCPVCTNNCEVGGIYYEEGDSVPSYDTCSDCSCIHGDVRCHQKQCDYLHCDDTYTPPGECCPKCPDNNGQ